MVSRARASPAFPYAFHHRLTAPTACPYRLYRPYRLKPLLQVELPDHALARPVEGPDHVYLADREAEQVDAQAGTGAETGLRSPPAKEGSSCVSHASPPSPNTRKSTGNAP